MTGSRTIITILAMKKLIAICGLDCEKCDAAQSAGEGKP